MLFGTLLLLIVGKGVLGVPTDRLPLEVENVGNGTASQCEEGKECTGPLVTHAVVHLLGEQNYTGTPHRTKEGLCGKSRCCLVLVGIDCNIINTLYYVLNYSKVAHTKVVVCRVV